ncbi:MAG: transglycosylase SLT domain-containing protein [Rhodanobacteraceae bacterium]
MSAHHTGIRAVLTLAACALLAACASQPQRPPIPATVTPLPAAPPPTITAAEPAPTPAPKADAGPWASIVANTAMDMCVDSRLIDANAAMYTRSPAHFEQLLTQSLPLIVYVHEQLQAAGIPGEFTMLPMVESSFIPSALAHRSGAAGLWQFIPTTARRNGLVVNRQYDGRLDPVASTQAAIRMLKSLDSQFGDWRLVTMAYNAGPQTIKSLLQAHPSAPDKPISQLRVPQATRTHLARLLALNCILSKPQRFHVRLPRPSTPAALATVTVPAGTRLKAAADMAGISEASLHALNPGYLGTRVPSDSPRTLLLPGDAAQTLAAALTIDSSEYVAQVDAPDAGAGGDDDDPLPAVPPRDAPGYTNPAPAQRHRVRAGETLWSIARHYEVSVRDLKRWNDLQGSDIQLGEWLRVQG